LISEVRTGGTARLGVFQQGRQLDSQQRLCDIVADQVLVKEVASTPPRPV
jgi:hypothetical protein